MAGWLECSRQPPVVLPARIGHHAAHVLRVIPAEFEGIRDCQLGIENVPPSQREEHAVALFDIVGALGRERLQILSENFGLLDFPVVLGLGFGDFLLCGCLTPGDLRLTELPDRSGDQSGGADHETRKKAVIGLDEFADPGGLRIGGFVVRGALCLVLIRHPGGVLQSRSGRPGQQFASFDAVGGRMKYKLVLLLVIASAQGRAASYPAPQSGEFVVRDFKFKSGEVLPELRIHYQTLGTAKRDQKGEVRNAVIVLHGTGGSSNQFLTDNFAGVLFGPGQLLDANRYFIVLPDGIGHGRSSKPSDGLHARFPRYEYDDMVRAHHLLLTQKLGVNHLRLVTGTSMGGMHSWVWGETYPEFMDALLPLASLPVQIAGRNRMMRRMIIDSIRGDPDWQQGEYKSQPRALIAAHHILMIMSSSALQWQKQSPTRDSADQFMENWVARRVEKADANDLLYQIEASRNYDPSPKLETIRAPLLAINSADDVINPPELGILENEIKRVKNGRAIVLPITDKTRGHGTHTFPEIWQRHLAELLKQSER